MSGHVKILACFLWLNWAMWVLDWSGTLISDCLDSFCNGQELMKTNIKVFKVLCHCSVGWMPLKLNSHDIIMVSFYKACIDIPRQILLSEWMEWPKTSNELTGIKNPTINANTDICIYVSVGQFNGIWVTVLYL